MHKLIGRLEKYLNARKIITALFLFTLLIIFFFINTSSFAGRLEMLFYDFKCNLAVKYDKNLTPSEDILIVMIDDWSLTHINDFDFEQTRWPWPRDIIADGLKYIQKSNPKAVVHLLLFENLEGPGKDDKLHNTIREIPDFFGMVSPGGFRIDEQRAIEKNLLEAIADKNYDPVLFKRKFFFPKDQYNTLVRTYGYQNVIDRIYQTKLKYFKQQDLPEKYALDIDDTKLSKASKLFQHISFVKHTHLQEDYAKVIPHLSLFFFPQDSDGAFRYDRPVYYYEKQKMYLPSLAFAPYINIHGNNKAILTDQYIEVAGKKIPLDHQGRMRLNFKYNFTNYHTLPFLKAIISQQQDEGILKLNDAQKKKYTIDQDTFKDKYIIVASDRLDLNAKTQVFGNTKRYANIKHYVANALDNYIRNGAGAYENFVTDVPLYIVILLTVLFCTLNYFFILKFENLMAKFGLIFVGLLFYIILSLSIFVIPGWRYNLPVVIPGFIILFFSLSTFFVHYQTVYQKKQEVEKIFGKFISPQVKQILMEDPSLLNYEGQKKEMSVIFTDLRGFTTISENSPPGQTIAQLNEYFTVMAKIIIYEYNGTLDKYIGDAIMAFWGDPLPQEDHAELAVKAAIRMIEKLDELNKEWEKTGWPVLNMGIGVNTGEMTVGHMGGEILLDYTVIGDNVNIASRLESLNKEYNSNIIISEATYEKVKDVVEAQYLEDKLLKGKTKAVKIYKVCGLK